MLEVAKGAYNVHQLRKNFRDHKEKLRKNAI
jgi:hypothetical protein